MAFESRFSTLIIGIAHAMRVPAALESRIRPSRAHRHVARSRRAWSCSKTPRPSVKSTYPATVAVQLQNSAILSPRTSAILPDLIISIDIDPASLAISLGQRGVCGCPPLFEQERRSPCESTLKIIPRDDIPALFAFWVTQDISISIRH